MTIYIFAFFWALLFCGAAQYEDNFRRVISNTNKIVHTREAGQFYFIATLILICVSGLRYRVGTDYGAYYNLYEDYAEKLTVALKTLDEPGYPFLAWIAVRTINDPATPIFFAAIITIGLPLIVIYNNSSDLVLSISLFITMGFWHGSFNGVRQYLAAAILFCGHNYLKERKLFRYLTVVFIAFLFHKSAAVMAVLYITTNRKIDIKNIAFTAVATFTLMQAYDRIFELANWVMDASYSLENAYISTTVNILRVFVACSPMLLFLIFYSNRTRTKEDEFYLNLVIFHAVLSLVTWHSALLYRIGIHTTAFQTIAIPKLLSKFPDKDKSVLRLVIIVLFTIYWIFELHGGDNFRWIWQR